MAAKRVMRDGTTWIAVLVAMLMVLLAVVSEAQAAPGTSAASPDDRAALAGVLVRDFGISEQQALANVDTQTRAGDIVSALEKSLGDGYAGVWFDNTSGQFRVGVAPSTDKQAAEQTLAGRGIEADSELVPVKSTWDELQAAAEAWTQRATALGIEKRAIVGVNAVTNSVAVTLSSEVSASDVASLDDAAASAPVNVNVVKGKDSLFEAQDMACHWPAYCDRPLGGAIGMGSPSASCTAGFLAFSNSGLNPYILTAGHCIHGPETWWTYEYSTGIQRNIGPAVNNTDGPAGDVGIIGVTDPFWNVAGGMSAKIAAWGTGNGNYLIYGGAWSYYSGR